jgi:predicted regulator of Ras-like GTPase activity (Roadblock/LC7/MglB family)
MRPHDPCSKGQRDQETSLLTSLFGDLGLVSGLKRRAVDDTDGDGGFAATAIMASVSTEVNARGQIIDRHSHDLVVTGSPAQAIRDHFADTRSDLDTASSLITLVDPAGVWASGVIKALSDAGGRPIERLHLREHSTLRTLATIERTTLVRRDDDTLRVVHADVRAPGSENAEIPVALMERSQMTTVIIGPLQPHAIDALLEALCAAAMLPAWRCPNLLFLLPPNAVWIANKVGAVAWPGRLQVRVLSESMTGASSVWNAMLGVWNQVKSRPGWVAPGDTPLLAAVGFPLRLGETEAPIQPASGAPAALRTERAALDPALARRALGGMLSLDGLLGCAIVDAGTGLVDLDLAAAACAQVLRAHRQAARSMGMAEQVDELMVSAGARQQVLRTVSKHPELFIFVMLEKHRTNLALARFHLMEIERGLV